MEHIRLQGRGRAVLALGLALLAACAGRAPAPEDLPPPPEFSTGKIAAVLLTVNRGEIEEAELARTRATAAEVRTLAKRLETDHTASTERLTALLGRTNTISAENELSRRLLSGHMAAMDTLRAAGPGAFDAAYVARQVAVHRRVLQIIDETLLPDADVDMKAELSLDRTAIAAHLQMAEQLAAVPR